MKAVISAREHIAHNIYRSRYRCAWLYSVYSKDYVYHQVVSDTFAASMDFDRLVDYLQIMHAMASHYCMQREIHTKKLIDAAANA